MIKKEDLKEYANDLMFEMEENEYETLLNEFDTFLNWMDYIGKIEDIEKVEPLYFPYTNENVKLRDDEYDESISPKEILACAPEYKEGRVSVPKVVE